MNFRCLTLRQSRDVYKNPMALAGASIISTGKSNLGVIINLASVEAGVRGVAQPLGVASTGLFEANSQLWRL